MSEGRRSGGVLVKIRTGEAVDVERLCREMLAAADLPEDAEVWACQHPCVSGHAHVTEALVVSAPDAVDRSSVRRAAADAASSVARSPDPGVEAVAVAHPAWFAESIRHASRTAFVWDARAKSVATREYVHDEWHGRAWQMLHGWLATVRESVAVEHPRALNPHQCATQLLAALSASTALAHDAYE